jgi:hypothetical protein
MLVYPIHGNNPKSKPQLPDAHLLAGQLFAYANLFFFPTFAGVALLQLHRGEQG